MKILNDLQVLEIRQKYANNESVKDIAKNYKIKPRSIYDIVSGRNFKHLPLVESNRKFGSDEWKENVRKGNKEHVWTEKHLDNLRIANSKERTEEHKKKLGAVHKGVPSWNAGIKGSVPGKSSDPEIEAERKRKISEHHSGREQPWCAGENHWNWLGDNVKTYPTTFRKIRPYIVKRDNCICFVCKNQEPKIKLAVHHIDHNKKNNSEFNLITLCTTCNLRAESVKNKIEWPSLFYGHVYFLDNLKYLQTLLPTCLI